MAQTIEYLLVTATSAQELTREVSQKLGDGWQLYGNPVIDGHGAPEYAQALVRDVTRTTRIGPV